MARFLLHIMAAFAKLERELIARACNTGCGRRGRTGTRWGGPNWVFRQDEAMRSREQGMSWRGIAAELGVPVTTVVEGAGSREFSEAPSRTRHTSPRQSTSRAHAGNMTPTSPSSGKARDLFRAQLP